MMNLKKGLTTALVSLTLIAGGSLVGAAPASAAYGDVTCQTSYQRVAFNLYLQHRVCKKQMSSLPVLFKTVSDTKTYVWR